MRVPGGLGGGGGTTLKSKFMAEFMAADRRDVATLKDTIEGHPQKKKKKNLPRH